MEAYSNYENPEKNDCIINNPSAFAKSNLVYLQEIGQQSLSFPHICKNKKFSSYVFFVVTDGLGKLEYGEDSYVISAGHCAFLDCRRAYSYYAFKDTLTLSYVHFDGYNMADIYKEYLNQGGVPCYRAHGPKSYLQILEQISESASSVSQTKDMEMYAKLTALLTRLMKAAKNAENAAHRANTKQDMQNVKKYLEQNYQERITLDILSELFYVNKFYLTRLFREQFGISVNNYLMQVRLSHAKRLLCSSDMSVKNIGRICGVGNANYFTRMFKKCEGMTPGEFREAKKNKFEDSFIRED